MSKVLIEAIASEMDRLGYGRHESHAESILCAIRAANHSEDLPALVAVALTDAQLDTLSNYIYAELGSPSDWCGFDYDGARACLDKAKELNQ